MSAPTGPRAICYTATHTCEVRERRAVRVHHETDARRIFFIFDLPTHRPHRHRAQTVYTNKQSRLHNGTCNRARTGAAGESRLTTRPQPLPRHEEHPRRPATLTLLAIARGPTSPHTHAERSRHQRVAPKSRTQQESTRENRSALPCVFQERRGDSRMDCVASQSLVAASSTPSLHASQCTPAAARAPQSRCTQRLPLGGHAG